MAAAPVEGAQARIEANPQAAEEFSALISMLIPGAAPENAQRAPAPPPAAQKTDNAEKKGSGEHKKEDRTEQPVVFPFPVQAFIPPVEIQPVAGGGQFTAEPAAPPAPQTNEADVPAPQANAENTPVLRTSAGEAPAMAQFEAAIPEEPAGIETAPAATPAPAAVETPAGEQDEPPEPVPQTGAPQQIAASQDAPVPAAIPAAAPAPPPAPAPAAAPGTRPVQAPAAPQPARPPEAVRPVTRKNPDRAPVEAEPETVEAAPGQKRTAPDAEVAFAARLTERAPAPVPARPVPADPVQPAPANPAPAERPSEAPPQAEHRETARISAGVPEPERIPQDRPAEPEKPAAAAPRQAAAGTRIEPAAPQAAPAQPARPAASSAQPERTAVPTPVARADFEPVRVDAAPRPVRELSMVVPGQGSGDRRPEPVEVRLVERAGQVHVAVRSSDPQLNRSLGEGLGELVTKLENHGYTTEAWRPQGSGATQTGLAAAADAPVQQMQSGAGHESFQESGRGHQGGAGEESSRQQRRGQDEARPDWLEMLEGAVRQRNHNPIRSTFA